MDYEDLDYKHISKYSLHQFLKKKGIEYLTAESDSLNLRILCDINESGIEILESYFDGFKVKGYNSWNHDQSWNSVLIPRINFGELCVFILFYEGYTHIVEIHDCIVGFKDQESREYYIRELLNYALDEKEIMRYQC